jgi:hypothetical protein
MIRVMFNESLKNNRMNCGKRVKDNKMSNGISQLDKTTLN